MPSSRSERSPSPSCTRVGDRELLPVLLRLLADLDRTAHGPRSCTRGWRARAWSPRSGLGRLRLLVAALLGRVLLGPGSSRARDRRPRVVLLRLDRGVLGLLLRLGLARLSSTGGSGCESLPRATTSGSEGAACSRGVCGAGFSPGATSFSLASPLGAGAGFFWAVGSPRAAPACCRRGRRRRGRTWRRRRGSRPR